MQRGRSDGNRDAGRSAGAPRRAPRGVRRLTSLLATALLVGAAAAPVFSQSAQAITTGDTVDLRVLLVGTTGGATDPTTAAWAAGLASQGVAYTEVDATGALGAQTIALPALTSSATHGLFNGVVLAGKPGDFAAGQLDALSAYESTFGIRQIDGNFVPPAGGILGLNPPGTDPSSGAGIAGTTPVLTAAGLFTFPALAGPVPIDTGTFGAPGAAQTSLPTGASRDPTAHRRRRQRAHRRVPAPAAPAPTPKPTSPR